MQLGLFELPADLLIEPKMITVRQPWAWAIFHAGKDIENRTWRYCGPLLICAGRKTDPEGYAFLAQLGIEVPDLTDQMGVIAGRVEVEGYVKGAASRWARPEVWNWVLTDAQAASRRIACVGSLGPAAAPARWQDAFAR